MQDDDFRLSPQILRLAYSQGYFPMPIDASGTIGWFRPNPRAVLPLAGFHTSRSLARRIKRGGYEYSFDQAFYEVMVGCADRADTWINAEFLRVYGDLHREGDCHSVEIWQDDLLVGGAYGLAIGSAFFAESMFSRVTDASKLALYHLVAGLQSAGFRLLEVQFLTPHLASLGAIEIPATSYQQQLAQALKAPAATFPSANKIPGGEYQAKP